MEGMHFGAGRGTVAMVTLVKFAWAKVRIQQFRIVWYWLFINHVLVQGWCDHTIGLSHYIGNIKFYLFTFLGNYTSSIM